jgi:hypothetical protein
MARLATSWSSVWKGHVVMAWQHQRGVDLVSEHRHVVTGAHLGDRGELSPRPHAAKRVVRVADQVRAYAGLAQSRVQRIQVQLVAAIRTGRERRLDDAPPGQLKPEEERRVYRRVDHDPGSRLGDGLDYLRDAGHDVGDREHEVRVGRPAQPVGGELREHLAELALVRITAVAQIERRRHGGLDRLGGVEVHLGHEHRQYVGGMSPPLKALATAQPVQGAVAEERVHLAMV